MDNSALKYALETSGKQLLKVFEGMPEDLMDAKLHDGTMSPRETLEHLCECYHAYGLYTRGQKHEWGTFSAADKATEPLKRACFDSRKATIEQGLAAESEEIRNASMDFVGLHDSYHVGQMASFRIAKEQDWNSYSLYE